MGLASVSAVVCDPANPCHLDSHTWFYNIYYCDKTPLTWCDKKFQDIEAKCGYLNLSALPPGCYVIRAYTKELGAKIVLTYPAMFQARCDENVCLKLIPTTLKLE